MQTNAGARWMAVLTAAIGVFFAGILALVVFWQTTFYDAYYQPYLAPNVFLLPLAGLVLLGALWLRGRLAGMGVRLFPVSETISSPTVTAAYVPDGWTWEELDRALRAEGMVVGGNYGELAGKVFRIGHMGTQADLALVARGMDVLQAVLAAR